LYTTSVRGVVRGFELRGGPGQPARVRAGVRLACRPHAEVFAAAEHAGKPVLVLRSPEQAVLLHTPRSAHSSDPGEPEPLLSEHTPPVEHAAITADGSVVVTAGHDFAPRLWRVPGGSEPFIHIPPQAGCRHAADVSADGTRLLLYEQQGFAVVPIGERSAGSATLVGRTASPILDAAFAPDGRRIVLSCQDGQAEVRTLAQPSLRGLVAEHGAAVTAARFSPDGGRLLTACRDQVVRVFELTASGVTLAASLALNEPQSVAFSADGHTVIIGSRDGSLTLWQVHPSAIIRRISAHQQPVWWTELDRTGGFSVTACADSTAAVWELKGKGAPQPLRELIGHVGSVRRAVFSRDGSRVLTASDDGTARVWNLQPERQPEGAKVADEVIVLRCPHARIEFCAFLPKGDVITATTDGQIRVWCLSVDKLQQQLKQANLDSLLPERRQTFLGESQEEAWKNYRACEATHHRTPLPKEN
jgi:WD40 repeat protein